VAQLNWCPQIEWDVYMLRFRLPMRPQQPVSRGIGGSEKSAAGVVAAYEVRRERLLRVTLRFYEWEQQQVEAWLEWAQANGQTFTVLLDQNDPATAVTCYLEAPAMGDDIAPRRSAEFLEAMELDVELRYAD
jgi:hypothetical protein